jgi:prophage maintenance system killer protein
VRLARLRTVTQEDDVGCQDLEQAMQIARFDRPLERLERVSDLGHGSLQVASHAFGADAYPTLELKAAALLHSLVCTHALVDGNKRLAWLATVVFLDLNQYVPDLDDHAAFDLVMDAAQSAVGVEEIAARLRVAPIATK